MASSSYKFLNCSKAQMCLFKILHIISSIPPFKQEPSSSHGDDRSESFPNNNNKGIGIDLNLRFCSVAGSGGESESSVIDQENNEEGEAIRDKSVEVSDNRGTQVQSFKVLNNEGGDVEVESESEEDREGNEVKTVSCGEGNCIDLLIEAAKVLSKREELRSDEKASEAEAVVVTSKRTRNRALPYRFRDSVVEPLKRAQGPSSTSHAKKRRLLGS